MASSRQDNQYRDMVLGKIGSSISLDEAIEWIKSNMNPEDVFDDRDLRQWADDNDFVPREVD